MSLKSLLAAGICVTSAAFPAHANPAGIPDTPFIQEEHVPYSLGASKDANDVRAVAVDSQDNVWAATKAGPFVLKKGGTAWSPLLPDAEAGPTFSLAPASDGAVWVGAWNGLYCGTAAGLKKIAGIDHPVAAVCTANGETTALGPDGMWLVDARGKSTSRPLPWAKRIRQAIPNPSGGVWIASGMGLYHHAKSGGTLYLTTDDLVSSDVTGVAYAADGSLWIGSLGGITVHRDGKRIGQFTPKEGLPGIYVQSIDRAPDGAMWVGLTNGLARYDGKTWSVRAFPRWLKSNDVRGVAFDSAATAWIATANGVSAITRASVTLAQKAQRFLDICLTRHIREPGLVEKCLLKTPGDITTWTPRDDDNDGEFTSMYLIMQSYRYAVTKAPQAKAQAKRAFDALHLLQTVTGTPGFVARSVVRAEETPKNDLNQTIPDKELADRRVRDPRDKYIEKHWRPSKDGKWLWKGDTSSDEMTGHFGAYAAYYDLVADEAERKIVREHVRNIMDYIVRCGYVFKDIDGTHTHWAVWSPELLNHDPDWQAERGINSVEILSYLLTTWHITGDDKYRKDYLTLLHKDNYVDNVRHAKIYNPASRTHMDDDLLALAYPALMLYEKDPELAKLFRESFDYWYKGLENDQSPYFNFVYGGLSGKDRHLDESIAFLRDAPMDLIRWTVDNSQREDLRLVRAPEIEPLQTDRMLPPSERFTIRWDENPWSALRGENGEQESDGVYWMLPYWMGRYYGFIQP